MMSLSLKLARVMTLTVTTLATLTASQVMSLVMRRMMTALTLAPVDQVRVMMSLMILMRPVTKLVTSQEQASLLAPIMTVMMSTLSLNTLATLLRMSRPSKKKMPTLSSATSNRQLIRLAARDLMSKTSTRRSESRAAVPLILCLTTGVTIWRLTSLRRPVRVRMIGLASTAASSLCWV